MDDFLSEESEPGSLLNAIQNSHKEEEAAQDAEEAKEIDTEFTASKHFSTSVEPSKELIDSLLAEIDNSGTG